MPNAHEPQPAVKDEDAAHPIASAWRPALAAILKAFTGGDYALTERIDSVAPVSTAFAARVGENIAAYGETLVELPDDTWRTSVAQWMETHWEILIDLWTLESGRSDLVLDASVFETADGTVNRPGGR